jgi:hypothetical protein
MLDQRFKFGKSLYMKYTSDCELRPSYCSRKACVCYYATRHSPRTDRRRVVVNTLCCYGTVWRLTVWILVLSSTVILITIASRMGDWNILNFRCVETRHRTCQYPAASLHFSPGRVLYSGIWSVVIRVKTTGHLEERSISMFREVELAKQEAGRKHATESSLLLFQYSDL